MTLSKKKTKIWLLSVASVLLTVLLVLSGVGIYFKLNPQTNKPKAEVDPLDFSVDAWDGKNVNDEDFNVDFAGRGSETRTIDSAESFMFFVDEVNRGYSFEGVTVFLNKSIDLKGYKIDSIGNEENPFKGTFDGGYYTLHNLYIEGNGLFEKTEGAVIKNLGLYNPTIKGTSEYVGGLIGQAVNTKVENCFVNGGKLKGEKVGGLIGQYSINHSFSMGSFISSNVEKSILNSFADTMIFAQEGAGLIHTVSNKTTTDVLLINNSYFTSGENAIHNYSTEDVEVGNLVKAENMKSFAGWDYGSKYEAGAAWCDYSYRSGSRKLEFNYPIQSGFVKVYLTGSHYESVVLSGDEIINTDNLSDAFSRINNSTQDATINLIVEKVFMEARAEAKADTVIKINAAQDTTIVRGDNNNDSVFVATGNSKIILGNNIQTLAEGEESATITIDGNREQVEDEGLESGALVVAYGGSVEIHDNVILQNNINTNTKYGGAVLLYGVEEEIKLEGTIQNCHAEHGGGAIALIGSNGGTIPSINNCSSDGNGGAVTILSEMEDEKSLVATRKLYGGDSQILPVRTQYTTPGNIALTGTITETYASGNGGAVYVNITTSNSAGVMILQNFVVGGGVFDSCYARSGGAIYVQSISSTSVPAPLNIHLLTFKKCYAKGYSQRTSGGITAGCLMPTAAVLPGFTITYYDGDGGAVYVNTSASIASTTVTSCNFENNFASNPDSDLTYAKPEGGAIWCGSDLTVMQSDFTSNTALRGGAIYSNGNVTIEGGSSSINGFYTNGTSIASAAMAHLPAEYGGAVYVSSINKTVTLSGNLSFYGNNAVSLGGAIYADDVVFNGESSNKISFTYNKQTDTASGGGGAIQGNIILANKNVGTIEFNSNIAAKDGGAIRGDISYSTNSVSSFVFSANKAVNGGAICDYDTDTSFAISNATFTGNTATGNGGAIHTGESNVDLTDTTFAENSASGDGGAIYAAADIVHMYLRTNHSTHGAMFGSVDEDKGNTATNHGGAIYADGELQILCSEDVMFRYNSAGLYGGAISADSCSILTGEGDLNFYDNSSDSCGGAIYTFGGDIYIGNVCYFASNSAQYGGAIATDYSIRLNDDCYFSNNNASEGGAIYCHETLTIDGFARFTLNSSSFGGAICMYDGTDLIFSSTSDVSFNGNTSSNGGAIYSYNADVNFYNVVEFTNNSATYGKDVYIEGDHNLIVVDADYSAFGEISVYKKGLLGYNSETVTSLEDLPASCRVVDVVPSSSNSNLNRITFIKVENAPAGYELSFVDFDADCYHGYMAPLKAYLSQNWKQQVKNKIKATFGVEIPKITSIDFTNGSGYSHLWSQTNYVAQVGADGRGSDASLKDGAVYAYISKNSNGSFSLLFGSPLGKVIYAPFDSSELFCTWLGTQQTWFNIDLTSINFRYGGSSTPWISFNGTEWMRAFLANNPNLTSVDFTGLDTSGVLGMAEFFKADDGRMNPADPNYAPSKLKTITGLDYLSVYTVKYMDNMFYGCQSLESLTIPETWYTGNLENVQGMFKNCTSLKTLDLSELETDSVTGHEYGGGGMSYMFQYCENLTTITGINDLDFSNVTRMEHMFDGCSSIDDIYIDSWDVCQVECTSKMFKNCSSLTTLIDGGGEAGATGYFGSLRWVDEMFAGCSNIEALRLDYFVFANPIEYAEGMFAGCSNLYEVWWEPDLSNCTSTARMFQNCESLEIIEGIEYSWDLSAVEHANHMFNGCKSLESIDLSYTGLGTSIVGLDNDGVDDGAAWMFAGCSNLSNITLDMFPNAQNIEGMFADCSSLSRINTQDQGIFDLSAVFSYAPLTNINNLFKNCYSLSEVDWGALDVSNVRDASQLFMGCGGLSGHGFSDDQDFSSCLYFDRMFAQSGIFYFYAEWDLSQTDEISMAEMFYHSGLYYFESCLDLSNVTNMSGMFKDCFYLDTVDFCYDENWEQQADGGNFAHMLEGCVSLGYAYLDYLNITDAETYSMLNLSHTEDETTVFNTYLYEMRLPTNNGESGVWLTVSVDMGRCYWGDQGVYLFDTVYTEPDVVASLQEAIELGSEFSKAHLTRLYKFYADANGGTFEVTDNWVMIDNYTRAYTYVGNACSGRGDFPSVYRLGYEFDSWTGVRGGEDVEFTGSFSGYDFYDYRYDSVRAEWNALPAYLYSSWMSRFAWGGGINPGLIGTITFGSGSGVPTGYNANNYVEVGARDRDGTTGLNSSVVAYYKISNGKYDIAFVSPSGQTIYAPIDSSSLFNALEVVTSIDLSQNFNTEGVTDMSYMFADCYNLQEVIGLNVIGLYATGDDESLDSNFNTDSVTNMDYMFANCEPITYARITTWSSLDNVASAVGMFQGCYNLVLVQESELSMPNLEDASYMFDGCSSLEAVDFVAVDYGSGYVKEGLQSLNNAAFMFNNCVGLSAVYFTGGDLSNLENAYCMFYNCSSLISLDFSGFEMSSLEDVAYMFSDCSALEYLDISSFDLSNVIGVLNMLNFGTSNQMFELDLPIEFGPHELELTTGSTMILASDGSLCVNGGYENIISDDAEGDRLIRAYTVTADPNGGTILPTDGWYVAGDGSSATTYFTYDDTSINNTMLPNAEKLGYSVTGWEIYGSSIDEDWIQIIDGDVIVAQWEALPAYFSPEWQWLLDTNGGVNYSKIKTIKFVSGSTVPSGYTYLCEVGAKERHATEPNSSVLAYSKGDATNGYDIAFVSPSGQTIYAPENCNGLFSSLTILTSIEFDNFSIADVTVLANMFEGCSSLTNLDLAGWNVSAVIDMSAMFNGCSKLTTITGIESWDTSNVQNMKYMFSDVGLTSLDIRNWNVNKVTTFEGVFYNSKKLESIYLTNWSISTTLTNTMSWMFAGCSALKILNISNFNLTKTQYVSNIFQFGATNKIDELYLPKEFGSNSLPIQTSSLMVIQNTQSLVVNGTSTTGISIYEGAALIRVNILTADENGGTFTSITGWSRQYPSATAPLIRYVQFYQTINYLPEAEKDAYNLVGWNTAQDGSGTTIFEYSQLSEDTTIYAQWEEAPAYLNKNWNTLLNIEEQECVIEFVNGSTAPSGYTNYVAVGATDRDSTEFNSSVLAYYKEVDYKTYIAFVSPLGKTIYAPYDSSNLFGMLRGVESFSFDNFSTEGVTNMSYMFYLCSDDLTSLDLSNFNTESVTDMSNMFAGCMYKLESITFGPNWKTNNVTSMGGMFSECYKLESLDLSSWNTDKVEDMGWMFYDCDALKELNISGFNLTNVEYIDAMLNLTSDNKIDKLYLPKNFGSNSLSIDTGSNMVISGTQSILVNSGTDSTISSGYAGQTLVRVNKVMIDGSRTQNPGCSLSSASGWYLFGGCLASKWIEYDKAISGFPVLTRVGYNFISFNTADNGTGTEITVNSKLTNDITIYPQWEIKKYTITWKDWDGTVLQVFTGISHGAEVVPPYEPTREPTENTTYTFSGWSPEVGPATGDQIYVAQYEEHVRTYTISIVSNDETIGTVDVSEILNVPYNSQISISGNKLTINGTTSTAKPGSSEGYIHSFANWSVSSGDRVAADATIVANFNKNPITYTITYNKNGSTSAPVSGSTADSTHTYNVEQALTTNGYSRIGYEFAGWNTQANGSGTSYTDGQLVKNLTATNGATVTFYAQWTPNKGTAYTVYHYLEKIDVTGTLNTSNCELADTDNLKGVTGAQVTPAVKSYTGFTAPTAQTVTIAADGSTKVYYYYSRNSYQVSLTAGYGISSVTGAGSYDYEKEVTVSATVKEGYTWSTWSGTHTTTSQVYTFEMSDSAVTMTASATLNTYTITYNLDGGTVATANPTSYTVETADITLNNPTKTGYTFTGWTGSNGTTAQEVVKITKGSTGNKEYTANWVINGYTITWIVEGEVKETDNNVPYGSTPEYNGATPTKAATAQYTYTFSGWTPAVTSVTGDATYTATFSPTVNKYTITFKHEDGTVLETQSVEYGKTPEYTGSTPTKTATAQYTYTFSGWSPAIASVTKDQTYTATFSPTVNKYTVTWKNEDGTVLETDNNVEYGARPVYNGSTPTKAATAQYSYTHSGWTPEVTSVTGNVTYTATFSKTVNGYMVRISSNDESLGYVTTTGFLQVPYGSIITINDDTLSVGEDRETQAVPATIIGYTTSFVGWSVENGTEVTGELNIVATFAKTANKYEVVYNGNGATSGSTATSAHTYDVEQALTANGYEKTGYSFAGWNTQANGSGTTYADKQVVKNLTATNGATVTLYAQWTINKFKVSIVSADTTLGTVDKAEILEVPYGSKITISENTLTINGVTVTATPKSVTGYTVTFSSWSVTNNSTVTADITITATFTSNINKFTVTFVASPEGYGTVNIPAVEQVPYGSAISIVDNVLTVDGTPVTATPASRTGYTFEFTGWSKENGFVVKSDVTITASFSRSTNQYSVKYDGNGHTSGSTATSTHTYDVEKALTANGYSRTGYTFAGWNTEANGTGTAYADKQVVKNLASDNGATVTLYAQWSINKFIVKIVSNKTEWGTVNIPEIAEVEYNSVITINENTLTIKGVTVTATPNSITGYTCKFESWSVQNGAKVTGNLTITATFSKTAHTYEVAYDGNGATSGEMENSTHTYDVAKALTANAYAKLGYSFAGWNTEANGSGTTYADKASVKNLTAEDKATVTLYAQWTQLNAYLNKNWKSLVSSAGISSDKIKTIKFTNETTVTGFVNYVEVGSTSLTAISPTTNSSVLAYYKGDATNGYDIEFISPTGKTIYAPENCNSLFGSLTILTSITFENFNTSNVENMIYMFQNTAALTNLDVSSFDVDNVTNMQAMFTNCSSLTTLKLSGWALGSVDMGRMFSGCSALLTITGIEDLDTSSVTRMDSMFSGCSALTSLDLSNWETTSVLSMTSMFEGCSGLKVLNISNFDLSGVGDSGAKDMLTFASDSTFTSNFALDKIYLPKDLGEYSNSWTNIFSTTVPLYIPRNGSINYCIQGTQTLCESETFTVLTTTYAGIIVDHTLEGKVLVRVNKLTADANGGSMSSTTGWSVNTDTDKGTRYVAYDETISVLPTVSRYGYNFLGWFTETSGGTQITTTSTISANTTIYAQWSKNLFTITWKNWDGTVLKSDSVAYGNTPSYTGATPTKPADAQYTYTFDKWSPDVTAVTGNATYTATFTSTVNNYTITWKNWDGTVLDTDSVAYGNTPSYTGATPTKTADAQYTYTFDKWTPTVVSVTGDATYTATFTSTVNLYTVTIVSNDTTLGTVSPETVANVPYGTQITVNSNKLTIKGTPVTATPKSITGYTCEFESWSVANGTEVKGDLTVTATFDKTAHEYTVVYNGNGYTSGSTADSTHTYDVEQALSVNGYAKIGYEFAGWNTQANGSGTSYTDKQVVKNLTATNGATVTLYAQWTPNKGTAYTVYHYLEKIDVTGTLNTSNCELADTENLKGVTDAEVTPAVKLYTGFTAPSAQTVTIAADGSTKVYYYYSRNSYQVSLTAGYGISSVTGAGSYDYEKEVTVSATVKEGYTWSTWSGTHTTTTQTYTFEMSDSAVTMTASATLNTYTITYNLDGGTVATANPTSYTVETADITLNNPTKTGYTFAGWAGSNGTTAQKTVTIAKGSTGNREYTANWTINTYTITWKNWDGTVLDTDLVDFGDMPEYTGATPTKPADAQYTYTFDKWSPDITNVTGAATYTATFSKTVNNYTVTILTSPAGYGTVNTTTVEEVPYGTKLTVNKNVVTIYGTEVTATETPADAQYTYHFVNWTNGTAEVTGDLTVTANFDRTVNTYTVTWVNEDGTVLETDTEIPYGEVPTYEGSVPTKPATAQYTYKHSGWTPTVTNVTGDVTYTATFEPILNGYTVLWKNEDGTVLETDANVLYGTTPEYNGATPTKKATAQYTYTFDKWTPDVTAVTGNAEYTATFTSTVNSYTITWKNWDGTVLDTDSVNYGDIPEYTGETPTRPADAQYTYSFDGWTPTIVSVTGNAEYTARLVPTVNNYTVTILTSPAGFGTVNITKVEDVPYGTKLSVNKNVVTINGTEVTATETPADAQYTYHFVDWTNGTAEVTGDLTVTANFNRTVNNYTVTILTSPAGFGTVNTTKVEDVPYGTKLSVNENVVTINGTEVTATETPADAQYTYHFVDWTNGTAEVTGDLTVTANFNRTVNNYTVTILTSPAGYGTVDISTVEDVPYGTKLSVNKNVVTINGTEVTATETPADAQYTYFFVDWTNGTAEVTGDLTVTANFDRTVNTYTVTWKNEDGTVLETDENIPYGTTPKYNGATPTKKATAQYTYTFDKWTPDITAVTGNAEYTATYTSTVNNYTVTILTSPEGYGTVDISTVEDVPYGTKLSVNENVVTIYGTEVTATETTSNAQYTYFFVNWTNGTEEVTGNLTVTANFDRTVNTYTVTWVNEDGTVLETDEGVEYGQVPSYEGSVPTKAATAQYTYTHSGWTPTIAKVTGDVTYTATFSATVNVYTVLWKNEDGTVLETDENIPYGTTPEYNGATPTKKATAQYTYTFDKWSPDIVDVTGNVEYFATYTATVNNYDVTINVSPSGYGTVSQSIVEEVPYGTKLSVSGKVVTINGTEVTAKETPADAEFTYKFEGWTNGTAEVTGDLTVTANFSRTVNTYTVLWKNDDGTVLETDENIPYGTTPKYDGATPTKEATAQYTYTFDKWSPDITAVTGNVEYIATYTATVNNYTVTILTSPAGYGTVNITKVEDVPYGTKLSVNENVVTINGTEVTATETPADAQYTYHFVNWTNGTAEITGDLTVTANFDRTVNTYTVLWKNEDGTVLETDTEIPYGEVPKYNGDTPTKEATVQYTYTFDKWSPDITSVTGDATYTATYTATINQYTVTFVDDNTGYGIVESSSGETSITVDYGTAIVVNKNIITIQEVTFTAKPTAETEEYSYEFASWTNAADMVTGDITIKANFIRLITVTVETDGIDGNAYGVNVYNANSELMNETPYEESFKLETDKVYTFKVVSDLINDKTNNKYQVVRVYLDGTKKLTRNSIDGNILGSTILSKQTIVENRTIKFEYLDAHFLTINVEDKTISGVSISQVDEGTNYISEYNPDLKGYMVADETVVTFSVNSAPHSQSEEVYTFIGFNYIIDGKTQTVGVNGGTDITRTSFVHNTQYSDIDVGTYSYSIDSNVRITELKVILVVSNIIHSINTTGITGTLILTSEHGFNKVVDASTQSLILYEGRWQVTTTMTLEEVQNIFVGYLVEIIDGKMYLTI